MDINMIVNSIKEKCQQNNYKYISTAIDEIIKSGSTGSEILSMVGKYLVDLKVNDPNVFNLISGDIREYLKYSKAQSIKIKNK